MNRILVLVLSATMLTALSPSQSRPTSKNKLSLNMRVLTDKSKEVVPGSKSYIASIVNNGDKTLKLQSVEMPGGYAGEGKFFPCALEGWNSRRRQWAQLWRSEVGPAPRFVDVEVVPWEEKDVCNMLLPSQSGATGECVRFKLRTRWQDTSFTVVSQPFVIGDVTAKAGPCRAKK
jgi:hypothetical protein